MLNNAAPFSVGFWIVSVLAALVGAAPIGQLGLSFDNTGSYNVTVDMHPFLYGGPTAFFALGSGLQLAQSKPITGVDNVLGTYKGVEYTYKSSSGVSFVCTASLFQETSAIVFSQFFPDELALTPKSKDDIATSFPTFGLVESGLGWFTYAGNMAWSTSAGLFHAGTKIPGGGGGGLPLILYDASMMHTFVISPFNNFMGASQATWDQKNVGFGVLGSADRIPASHTQSFLLVLDSGVNTAMSHWGTLLKQVYGKTTALRDSSLTSMSTLGYWTDNGACYYYYNGSYDDIMAQVKQDATKNALPFRYLQLDSWWYFKGPNNGCKNWTAMPSVLPKGITYLSQESFPEAIVAHARWWSYLTDYAKHNGGPFNFATSGNYSLPLTQDFWDYIMSSSKQSWGLSVYEQDWLDTQFDNCAILQSNITMGRTWLKQMGAAASANNITIQYCMPYPRHVMQSVEVAAVTTVRASDDYHAGNTQWKIGDTSILADVLGLAPFKDNFHTSKEEPGCSGGAPVETNPQREAYVSALSTSMVGTSDGVGMANATLIKMLCMQDGTLLKTSAPAKSVDLTFVQRSFGSGGPKGQVWGTHSSVPSSSVVPHMFGYLFVSELTEEFALALDQANMPVPTATAGLWAVFDPLNPSKYTIVTHSSDTIALPSVPDSFYMRHVVPVIQVEKNRQVFILGELDKIVSVSIQRFKSVTVVGDVVVGTIQGVPGETVHITFAISPPTSEDFTLTTATSVIPASGTTEVVF